MIWDKGLFAMSRGLVPLGPRAVLGGPQARRPEPLPRQRDQSTVWRAPSPKMIMGGSDEEKYDHPAQKPVLLSEIPIRNHLGPGEIVYDPFLGSGTTPRRRRDAGPALLGSRSSRATARSVIDRWQVLTGGQAVRVDG